ncbi:Protein of unknown function [Propionibacterium freudenreichii]|nr:Protein of unknown function [Propionibacterium freudenreichii]CEI23490.1 Protein of unknown function [Propionibacterium freudenreichii]CEI27813.1 Protein of unknown function [Propionibacterium freudenreichii]
MPDCRLNMHFGNQ